MVHLLSEKTCEVNRSFSPTGREISEKGMNETPLGNEDGNGSLGRGAATVHRLLFRNARQQEVPVVLPGAPTAGPTKERRHHR